MLQLTCDNPLKPAYFYPIVGIYLLIFGLTYLIMYYVKKYYEKQRQRCLSISIEEGIVYPEEFIKNKDSLKYKYLSAYTLTRASMWAKAPYLYVLYNKYHGFDVQEIGILYVVDAVSGLISGPIFGYLSDRFGRKLFCLFYCLIVFTNLSLRLTGNRPLAYIAQIITGFGAGLINSTFESWVVYESEKVFKDRGREKEKFLKRLFKNINLYDAIISVVVSSVAAVIFTQFGVLYAIGLSMCLSLAAFFVILFLWGENRPNSSKNIKSESFGSALKELKKRDVLSIGIIESIFQACLNLFIFAWTPILQGSTTWPEINVGFIFICYVMVMIFFTVLYELFIIYIKSRYYLSLAVVLLINTIMWYLVYTTESFFWRMQCLSIINGIYGFYTPLNSLIKSKILVERHRATLMSIFRVPLNIYVIVILLALKYTDTFTICLIAFGMMFVAFVLAVLLFVYPPTQIEQYTEEENDPEEKEEYLELQGVDSKQLKF